jgi:hypothetical protein
LRLTPLLTAMSMMISSLHFFSQKWFEPERKVQPTIEDL